MPDTKPKERPIVCTAAEIHAVREGRTSELWRPIKRVERLGPVTEFQPSPTRGYDWIMRDKRALWNDLRHEDLVTRSPFGEAGDILWIRETFYVDDLRYIDSPPADIPPDIDSVFYRADGECCQQIPECQCADVGKPSWRPSTIMPRWMARLFREIESVSIRQREEVWFWCFELNPVEAPNER